MFFDIYDDLYKHFIVEEKMSFIEIVVLYLKIFWNLFLISAILSLPFILFKFVL